MEAEGLPGGHRRCEVLPLSGVQEGLNRIEAVKDGVRIHRPLRPEESDTDNPRWRADGRTLLRPPLLKDHPRSLCADLVAELLQKGSGGRVALRGRDSLDWAHHAKAARVFLNLRHRRSVALPTSVVTEIKRHDRALSLALHDESVVKRREGPARTGGPFLFGPRGESHLDIAELNLPTSNLKDDEGSDDPIDHYEDDNPSVVDSAGQFHVESQSNDAKNRSHNQERKEQQDPTPGDRIHLTAPRLRRPSHSWQSGRHRDKTGGLAPGTSEELGEQFVGVFDAQRLPYRRAFLQRGLQVLVGWDVLVPVEQAERNPVAPHKRPLDRLRERGLHVARVVVLLLQIVDALSEEIVRVDLVVCNAGRHAIDEGESVVLDAVLDEFGHALHVPAEGPRHVRGPRGKREGDGIHRILDDALDRSGLRLHSLLRGRARLARRESVDLVVHHQVRDVEVPSHRVNEVPHPDSVSVPVAAGDNDLEIRIRELRALRDRQRPSVDRVESVRRQEVRQVARASDPGDDQDVPWLELECMDRHLERPQDREVPAAGAPGRFDLGLVRVHLELEFHATASRTLSAMSRQVKGSPSYFPKKWSGLYPVSARRRRVNWPV